jgi:ankyrin repeat protein
MKKRFLYVIFALMVLAIIWIVGTAAYKFILNDELNKAASSADVPRIDALLARGAKVNGCGMHGMTPLMSACRSRDLATVRHLIDKGADINGHNDSGSVLFWAIESGNPSIVRALLDDGVDTQWMNCLGQDAHAFAMSKGDKAMLKLVP